MAVIHADFVSSRVWTLTFDGNLNAVGSKRLALPPRMSVVFGEDEAGELFIIGYWSTIYRFFRQQPPIRSTGFPTQLSGTGLFASTTDLQPANGLIPYDVAAPFGRTGSKQRWIAIHRPAHYL
ncbi:MAG: hypothetical protein R3F38_18975 [Gammaproteobacteria bacterium]